MKNLNTFFLILLLFVASISFKDFFILGKYPIPSDTIIGLYHPFRDLVVKEYPSGIPYKNFLITDPVRQQYPWRYLGIEKLKKFELPIWNPYNATGAPLLANMQSASLYPLNSIFLLLPFNISWSILVFSQIILSGIFMYLYLSHMRLAKVASFFGAVTFTFSGFSVAWLEWNTIMHTALWLPIILLSIENLLKKNSIKWLSILLFSAVSIVFAGHLQTLFYCLLIICAYVGSRLFLIFKSAPKSQILWKKFIPLIFVGIVIVAIASIQLIPTMQFISESAREIDQASWQKEGWFIPWQHLFQFIAPDFFGNPTTLNYWSVYNYGEFIGYVGIVALLLSFFALYYRKDKKTLFFGSLFFISLIFSLPTIFAKLPYLLNIPFLSTSQPTRLLFITDFSLAILAALGLDAFISMQNKNKIFIPIFLLLTVFMGMWAYVLIPGVNIFEVPSYNLQIALRNLLLPTIIFVLAIILFTTPIFLKNKMMMQISIAGLVILSIIDLLRFTDKFTPFTDPKYLFPRTKTLKYLQANTDNYRIMSLDSRILPPNFSIMYNLQSVEVYDPLYLRRYGELVSASESQSNKVSTALSFNRIITPRNIDSRLIDLMGVKYVLSLADVNSKKLKKVFQEGNTLVYENTEIMPRVYFVQEIIQFPNENKEKALATLQDANFDLETQAIVEGISKEVGTKYAKGTAEILNYGTNKVTVRTENSGEGFLVLTDAFYPTWHAKIYNEENVFIQESRIYRTNYNFRGINVPKGKHIIEFYVSLF